jgi:hypothetical protein
MRKLAAFALFLTLLPADAQDQPALEAGPTQSYETLEPRLRRAFFQRAADFIRTPDGRIWDGWGQRAYREALKENTVTVSEGVYESSGVFRQRRETGKRLDVRDTPEAKAWKLEPRLKAQSPIIVPLWSTLEVEPGQPHRPFYYINQQEPGADLDPVRIVLAPEDLVIKDAQLPGEFILWRAPNLKPPAHIQLPKNQSAYRYIPLDDIRLTTDELVAAALEGKAELAEWEYRRSGTDYVWRRSVATPTFRELRPVGPAPGADRPPEAEASQEESPGPVEPTLPDATHILRLNDGRVLTGRLIRRESDRIVFVVRTGSVEFETRFAAADIEAIDAIE